VTRQALCVNNPGEFANENSPANHQTIYAHCTIRDTLQGQNQRRNPSLRDIDIVVGLVTLRTLLRRLGKGLCEIKRT
jgi:hypothetical protein